MIDGTKIRALREAQNLTLRGLAARIGDRCGITISAAALGRIETGDLDPSIYRAAAIADALGVALESLLRPLAEVCAERQTS